MKVCRRLEFACAVLRGWRLVFDAWGLREVLACYAGGSPDGECIAGTADPEGDPLGLRIANWSSGMTFAAISYRWADASAFSHLL